MKIDHAQLLSLNLRSECRVHLTPAEGGITLIEGSTEYQVTSDNKNVANIKDILRVLDGSSPYGEIRKQFVDPSFADEFVLALYDAGLAKTNNSATEYMSGSAALAAIEDHQFSMLYDVLYHNRFWVACKNPQSIPKNVLLGMAIENYHFLYRESWFDTPVLSYLGNETARLAMNRFYGEEYGHDELIFEAITQLGVTRDNVRDIQPLPQTLALCNCLSHWAATDPLFFFSTLGVLEGKDPQIDTFVKTMEQSAKIDRSFIEPIHQHALINIEGKHGALTTEIFDSIDVIQNQDVRRMIKKTKIFIDLYDDFYSAVWDYYSNESNPVLRFPSSSNMTSPREAIL